MSKELRINRRLESLAQAREVAVTELHNHNRNQVSGSLSMLGNPLAVGLNVEIQGAGKLSGKYHLTRAVHSFSAQGGYSTAFDIRMAAPDAVQPRTIKDATGKSKQIESKGISRDDMDQLELAAKVVMDSFPASIFPDGKKPEIGKG